MARSRIFLVGDALVDVIKTFLPDGDDTEVRQTFFARRFDAAKTQGRKIYVVPRSDVMGDREAAGDRAADPLDYLFSVVVAERIPTTLRTWDDKDAWVFAAADFVTTVRNRLQNMREDPVIASAALYPLETGEREIADMDMLTNDGVFVSEFTHTVREVF